MALILVNVWWKWKSYATLPPNDNNKTPQCWPIANLYPVNQSSLMLLQRSH